MGTIASQITSLTIVYSTVYSDADERKHQSSGSLAFLRGIHRGPVNSPHKWPGTRKMFPFDDVIMNRVHSLLLGMWDIQNRRPTDQSRGRNTENICESKIWLVYNRCLWCFQCNIILYQSRHMEKLYLSLNCIIIFTNPISIYYSGTIWVIDLSWHEGG